MEKDEREIRALVDAWLTATRAGDVETVLDLITDDVVFLSPGRPPMRKEEFASVSRAQSGPGAPVIDGHSEIQEIQMAGDWAFLWAKLEVTVTPQGGAPPLRRAGHTLTVLRRERGRWRLARDANLLSPA